MQNNLGMFVHVGMEIMRELNFLHYGTTVSPGVLLSQLLSLFLLFDQVSMRLESVS